jgi:hypothetical protein
VSKILIFFGKQLGLNKAIPHLNHIFNFSVNRRYKNYGNTIPICLHLPINKEAAKNLLWKTSRQSQHTHSKALKKEEHLSILRIHRKRPCSTIASSDWVWIANCTGKHKLKEG